MKLETMTISQLLEKQCALGIKGIFTAHGRILGDLYLNVHLKQLLDSYIFEKIIFLKPKGKRGEIEEIFTLEKESFEYI